MRCPKCGKVYPANVKNCTNHNCKQELLISESEYNRRFHPVTHKTYKDLANDYIKNKEFAKQQDREINKPQCPTCHSYNVRPISSLNRAGSVFAWGLFSSKIGKTYECLNCKYKW